MGNNTSNNTIPPFCLQPFAFPVTIINGPYCDPGYYCPNIYPEWNFTFPSVCQPTLDCIQDRLASKYCPAQGLFEPIVCLAGHYCPNFTTMLPCPEGSYCLRGSTEPIECPPMSICPPETEVRRYYGGIVLFLIFDFFLIAGYFILRYYYEPHLWKQRKLHHQHKLETAQHALLGDDIDNKVPTMELKSFKSSLLNTSLSSTVQKIVSLVDQKFNGNASSDNQQGYEALKEKLDPSSSSSSGQAPSLDANTTLYCAETMLKGGFRKCNAGLRLDLDFLDLRLTLPPPINKTILSDVTGRIRPGRVTAIMGPSGAGKTTFLSVLMGRVSRTGGTLKINGELDEMYRYKKIVGFVPQEDTMMRELTVRENILFSARVRLPRHGWSDKDIQDHVDAVIDVLGLTECADTLSDNVSGGQRKRTNIGMELAMAPAAIFLDEPTSGLDSTAALEVCRTLKSIADLGLTVVAVIHQPRFEIFETFDDLLLLAPGGMTVYMGPQRGVLPYFGDMGFTFAPGHNPADDLLDFVAGKGSVEQMEGFWNRMDLTSGILSSSKNDDGFNSSPDTSFSSEIPANSSYSSLNNIETGDQSARLLKSPSGVTNTGTLVSSISNLSSPRTKVKMATLLAQVWTQRGPAHVRKLCANMPNANMSNLNLSDIVMNDAKPTINTSVGSLQVTTPRLDKLDSTSTMDTSRGVDDDNASACKFDRVKTIGDRGASFIQQVYLCHNRSLVQQYRSGTSFAIEMGVGILAGGVMGAAASQMPELYVGVLKPPYTLISPSPIEILLPSLGLYVSLAVGLAGSPAGVKTFGEERAVYYREASSGHNKLAYYIAKSISMIYRLTLGSFHFAALFHCLAAPSSPFGVMFIIILSQYFAVYGLAAVTSMLVKRENSALLGVIVSLVAGVLCGFGPSLVQMRDWGVGWVNDMSYSRWANEAWMHYETLPYRNMYMVEEVSAPLFGYTLDRFGYDIGMIMLIGLMYRVIAYLLLIYSNRDKQR